MLDLGLPAEFTSTVPNETPSSGLNAVYLEHRKRLLRFLRARGAGDDAEDLLQQVWLNASSGASAPIGEPLAYLYRVANNLLLDQRRTEVRRARRENAWLEASATAHNRVQPPIEERVLLAREELAEVEQTLNALGERTSTIFRKFRVEGVGQRDIAREMSLSLSAVEKHLKRAYSALIELRRQSDAE